MILTTPPNNIVNKKCHRVQNGHAQVIARNEREKNRQYLLIERHRVTKLLLRKFDTYYICFVDIDLLCPDTSLSCSFFSLALHTSPLNFLHIRFFFDSSIPCLVVYYRLDDVRWSDSHTHSYTPIWPKCDAWPIRFMIIWKKFISTRFRYEFTNVLIQAYSIIYVFNQMRMMSDKKNETFAAFYPIRRGN